MAGTTPTRANGLQGQVGWLSFLVLLIAMFVATPLSVLGAAESDTLRLDWEAAWELALERNESLKLARADAELTHYRVKEAYSAAMPTVSLDGVFSHYFVIPSTPVTMPGELNFADPGVPFTVKFAFGQENNLNGAIQLTQPLWLAGKVGLALKAAKDFERITELGVQVSREDLRVLLMQSFFGVLIAEEYHSFTRDALAQAERYRSQVNGMYEQGVVSEYDLIRASVAVSNLKPQVSQAEAARDLAYKGLKSIVGLELGREIEIIGDLETGLAAPELSYDHASQLALDKRLELQQLSLQKNLYSYQYEVERKNWFWPNFLIGFRYETTAQSPDLNVGQYAFLNGFGGQLMLQIPLFDGFASRNRAQQAHVNMKKVQTQIQQAERGIQVQVYKAMRDFQKASEELAAALENVQQAQKGYSISQTRYSGGVGTQIEVLDAQLQLNQSRIQLMQAKYNKLIAKAQYDRAIGERFSQDSEE